MSLIQRGSLFDVPGVSADTTNELWDVSLSNGLLPAQWIRRLLEHRFVRSDIEIEPNQIQPASLDLRLGNVAYRLKAGFVPGPNSTVESRIDEMVSHRLLLEGGAIMEKGGVYLVELAEYLRLPQNLSAAANPKSSTGRLDVFTRLIIDRGDRFDVVPAGYHGKLWAEVSPRTFSVKVAAGDRLNQIRFRKGEHRPLDDNDLLRTHAQTPLVDGPPLIRGGLNIRVNLARNGSSTIGYRANKYSASVDLRGVNRHDPENYWTPIKASADGSLLLEPGEFYILASKEKLHIPRTLAAEMVAFDPMVGEFRVHYAGFFDPGFGVSPQGEPGSRAVLEVRTYDMPFRLAHEQVIGRLEFEYLSEAPEFAYGEEIKSHYQGQTLRLSKHFKQ